MIVSYFGVVAKPQKVGYYICKSVCCWKQDARLDGLPVLLRQSKAGFISLAQCVLFALAEFKVSPFFSSRDGSCNWRRL